MTFMPVWLTVAGIILPGYARFDYAARVFAEKSAKLCKAPSQNALDATRAAAREALLAPILLGQDGHER